ncbi:MAG: CaiB/BaiF CoA transferase family protein [Pseudomonadales bacterium]
MSYPLAGLKVLDFSRVLAGPFAGRMLSDLGADVVKVEPPEGDVTRYWGRVIAHLPGYYHQQNAGKRNICVDLRQPSAKELIFSLVAEADIVIENYRPDVMARLGLGYEDLKRVNAKIIMLSISGFGHNGPESKRPAYAPVIHSEAGLIHRSSAEALDSGLESHFQDLPLSVADTNASLHGLVAVLAAVILRSSTGEGQHIDIAMIDATIATDDKMHYDLEDAQGTGPMRNEIWQLPCGTVLISTDFRLLFKLLVSGNHLVDPSAPDASLNEKISARRAAVQETLAAIETLEEFDALMKAINVAWGLVRDPSTIQAQPTVAHRRSVTEIDNREGGTRPITQSPYRFSNAESGVRGPAPHRGEHNCVVLEQWLGMTQSEVDGLAQAGILLADEEACG